MGAPVKKNERVELTVDSLAFGGNGVARLNGFVVFVRRALPGDTVRAEVTKVRRGYAEATTVELLEPGPGRVEPRCQHVGVCGGCRFQDYAYELQADAKEEQVRDAFERIARMPDVPIEPIVPARSQFEYRNKLEYSFSQTERGPALGFHRAGRWDQILEVERCHLTGELGNRVREAVVGWARDAGLEAYDQETHEGFLRHLVVREARNTGQILTVLVTAPGELDASEELVVALTNIPEVRSIHWAVNDRPAEVTNLPTELLWGEEAIEEELSGLRFRVRPNAFMQTNTEMAEVLYETVVEFAGLTGEETVYDLYAGTGTIGLVLAGHALTVWGVELSEESVACAIENAALNGIVNAAYFAGDVAQSLEELLLRSGTPDLVVVDPPRAGLSKKAMRGLTALEAARIVYVSCNPTTLAPNVVELVEAHGYEVERVRPIDMFPHTPHIEAVTSLRRASSSPADS
jgi:23S rRNA (uracil1939-C5)-methyltransferase